jgi:hypothetical protein
MGMSIGSEVREALLAAYREQQAKKPKPKPELVAETEVVAESVQVGLVRSVGDTLKKIDPAFPQRARFATVRLLGLEARAEEGQEYVLDEDGMYRPGRRVNVQFEYHPYQAFDASVPSFNRRKG